MKFRATQISLLTHKRKRLNTRGRSRNRACSSSSSRRRRIAKLVQPVQIALHFPLDNRLKRLSTACCVKLHLLAVAVGRHVLPTRLELLVAIHQIDEAIARLITLQVNERSRRQISQHFTHQTILGRVVECLERELLIAGRRVHVKHGQVEAV